MGYIIDERVERKIIVDFAEELTKLTIRLARKMGGNVNVSGVFPCFGLAILGACSSKCQQSLFFNSFFFRYLLSSNGIDSCGAECYFQPGKGITITDLRLG